MAHRRLNFLVFTALALVIAGLAAVAGTASDIAPQPLDAVILVDESRSVTQAGVANERDAAVAMINSDPSRDSQFLVAGFGSTSSSPGYRIVNDYCHGFVVLDSEDARTRLARCANEIHIRAPGEGSETDQPSAL